MKSILPLIFTVVIIAFVGCPTPPTTKEEPEKAPVGKGKTPAVPAISLRIAGIDLSHYSKRISRDDVQRFAAGLQHDSIDVLAVQGIVRYPDLTARVDFVDELSRQSGLRNAFGETISVSGRQSGNAVFSIYPIRSSENTHYENLHSTRFEAALQAVVDCGARDLIVVSTELPERAPSNDLMVIANTLGSFGTFYPDHPIVVLGNLPKNDPLREMAQFDTVHPLPPAEAPPQIWYSKNGTIRQHQAQIENTVFGTMTITQFGIYPQSQRSH